MHRFFADPSQIGEKEIVLTGADVNHIRNVLRMRTGEELLIADGQGSEYRCLLEEAGEHLVRAKICWKLDGDAELPTRITLFQGLPKSDKMDFIVQKCVEDVYKRQACCPFPPRRPGKGGAAGNALKRKSFRSSGRWPRAPNPG